jgi:hypothetical protein
MLVMDGSIPSDAYQLESVWRDPSTPTFAAKSDGVVKLQQAGIIPIEQARIEMGYSDVQRRQMREWDKDDPVSQMNALLLDGTAKANEQIGKVDPNAANGTSQKAA